MWPRKVEPETTDWALHTRIPGRIEPLHVWLQLSADRSVRRYSKRGFCLQRFLSFSFFFVFQEDDQEFFPGPDVIPIYLFVYLCIYFYSPATLPSLSSSSQASSWKDSSPPSRLFASKQVHWLWSTIISSWSITPPFSLTWDLESNRNFRSSPEVGNASSK